jgi:two-component system chemotaxis response regulator CheB
MRKRRAAQRRGDRSLNRSLNQGAIARDVIVIGASAGGVEALMQLFSMLPPNLRAIIGCVLHRGAAIGRLAEVLGRRSSLPVVEPQSGDEVKRGVIYLAPADHHMLFEQGKVTINRGPREHSTRPAIDPLFRSAAETYGKRVVGVVLTGCGEDGVSGMTAIGHGQGLALVQDPAEAYMPYMPLNALRFDHVHGAYPLEQLAPLLASFVRGE